MGTQSTVFTRDASILASRVTVVVGLGACFGSYFLQPEGPVEWTLDILLRTYFHFILGGMAHEASHGHLGRTRASNLWWGRVALAPTMVPYVTFRKTHIAHHRHTNIPGDDPDEYLNTPDLWQRVFRVLSMPTHWVLWLWRRGEFNRAVALEYALTWLAYLAVFVALGSQLGWTRVIVGFLAADILHAFLLWIPFAIKTHEGYSTGDERERSHDYKGRFAFWLTFGLSLHRVHHMKAHLAWLQMYPFVQPCSWWQALTFRRHVHASRT